MTTEGKIQSHIMMLKIPQKDIDIALSTVTKEELVAILDSISLSPNVLKTNVCMELRQRLRNIRLDRKTANYIRELQTQSDSNTMLSADEQQIVDLTIRYIEDVYDLSGDDSVRLRDYRYLRNAYPASISRIDSEIVKQLPALRLELAHVGAEESELGVDGVL